MKRKAEVYKGDERLNKHPVYRALEPASKLRVERMMKTVVKNWMNGRATPTSEAAQAAQPTNLYFSAKGTGNHRPGIIAPTTLLKELMPYIPVHAGRLFYKMGRGRTLMKDAAMHEKLRAGFSHTNSLFSAGGRRSSKVIITSLNTPESRQNREVLFFPNFEVKKVATKPFLEKLEAIHQDRLKEWFLGKGTKALKPIASWERREALRTFIKKGTNVTSSHSRSRLP